MSKHVEERYARKEAKKKKSKEFSLEISRKGLKRGWVDEDKVTTFSPRKNLGKNQPKRYIKSLRNISLEEFEDD